MATRHAVFALLISVVLATGLLGGVSAQAAAPSRISFAEPREFATGAVPLADAFNRATGDQLGWPTSADASRPSGASQERSRPAAKGISFRAPVDFATGAAPSSAAFNVAHGDQMPLAATRATPLIDSVAVGDFNGDGKPDVAQTNVIAGTVSVFLGNGRGGFAPPQQHSVGVNPVFVIAGDLDLDRNVDLAVANAGSNNVSILRGDGKGGFLPAFFVPVPTPRNVAIGEFNGDGIPDLAVASLGRATGPASLPGGVAILTGNKGSSFSPAQLITPTLNGRPVSANYVAVGDFDGSGFDDLAVGVGSSPSAGDQQQGDTRLTGDDVLIFLNRDRPMGATPEQPFSAQEQHRLRVGGLPNSIAVVDLNGDAHLDLAVLSNSGHITTLVGDGQGTFAVKATNNTVGALPFALAAGDFNDDRVPDLVTANWTSSTVSVLQGNGDGTFQPAVDFWSGDATTSAAVGDFDGDGRLDIVAARLRNDHLALLVNESPQRDDGVVITRDIPYGSPTHPTNDPFAAHHTLDVYTPPEGTPSFSGRGSRYPVVLFAHGGGGFAGDKTMVSYVMRSLALEGLVAVSIDYRLASPAQVLEQMKDVAQAFRWTRDNVGSTEYGGDPNNIFVSGTSNGALLVAGLATNGEFIAEQKSIRGLVVVGGGPPPGNAPNQPPSLLLNGDESVEIALISASVAFSASSKLRGADSAHVIVPGRDHMTIVSRLALSGDPGRMEVIKFLRSHLANP